MHQMSEEDSQRGSSSVGQWGEILLEGFRRQPLRFLGISEDVIKEVFIELLSIVELNEYLERSDGEQTIDPQKLGMFQLELISRKIPTQLRDLGAASVESLIIVSGWSSEF